MSWNSIVVHLVRPDSVSAEMVSACLRSDEVGRAGRFKQQRHATIWSAYRAALRLILGRHLGLPPNEVPLTLTEHGKPVLGHPFESIHFNLTHCDDLALVAISSVSPLGIDVEPLNRADGLLECEATFCHPQEILSLPEVAALRSLRLLEIWTAKEAFLKSIGTGLLSPPEQVKIETGGGQIIAMPNDGEPHPVIRLEHPLLSDHMAHLCALQPVATVEMVVLSMTHEDYPQSEKTPRG